MQELKEENKQLKARIAKLEKENKQLQERLVSQSWTMENQNRDSWKTIRDMGSY